MECRTSGALRRKALDRILNIFPDDAEVYENWQRYTQIYSMGYKDAPSDMGDVVNYWSSLGYDYNAGFEEGTRRALLRVARKDIYSIRSKLVPLRSASPLYIYCILAYNSQKRNAWLSQNRISLEKELMMTMRIL